MKSDKINFKILNLLMIIGIICLLYMISGLWVGILNKVVAVLFPFVLAFVIAYALYPFVRRLSNVGFPKWLAVGTVIFILVGFLTLILILFVPMLYDQVVLFLSNISAFIADISSKYEIDLGALQTSFGDISKDVIKTLSKYLSDGAINVVNTSISVISTLIITAIVSVYFLWDMDKIRSGVKKKLKSMKNRSYAYVKALDIEISNYLKGLGLFMVIQFFEYSIVFLIAGHPNWLLFGILACLTTVIPYFGGLITNILALITASAISSKVFFATLIVCLIFPQLDGYLISPKVYGKTNNINPLVTIMVVSVGGTLGGMFGIIIALPIYILISSSYRFFKKDIERGVRKVKEQIK